MGAAKSVPVTPARPPPHNKHLARVADPRSPTAGIQRTPIQVESTPQTSQPGGDQLDGPKQAQDADPRSPTLGIARTPMKTGSADPQSPLVTQLCEVFETEATRSNIPPERVLPLEVLSSSELDLSLDAQLVLEDQMPPWSQPELTSKQAPSNTEGSQPTEIPVTSQSSDKPLRDPETPRPAGSKHSRRKPNSKALGRSPLTILPDDNSPGTVTPRQGKRPSPLSENVREPKEGTVLRTGQFLKTGGRAWEQAQEHDKENQHFSLVES